MIPHLEARRRYWDNPRSRAPYEDHDLAGSVPYPFEPVEYLFRNKDVLEIGPGRGRQYDRLRNKVNSYSVCDISRRALEEPIFASAENRCLLLDYTDDFKVRFDVVHFWYVLHHITVFELDAFFSFVARHLVDDGLALFNTPHVGGMDIALEWYGGNGIGTTWIDRDMAIRVSSPYFTLVSSIEQNERSSGYTMVMRKV